MRKEEIITIGQARIDYYNLKLETKRSRRLKDDDMTEHKHTKTCHCEELTDKEKAAFSLCNAIMESGKLKKQKEEIGNNQLYSDMLADAEDQIKN